MKYKKISLFVILSSLMVTFISGLLVGRSKGIPFVAKKITWSIGIYRGDSPFNLFSTDALRNPVLTAMDITDISAEFVADPFMVRDGSTWYMFFEVMNGKTLHGDIGLATSNNGLKWDYQKIVLDEPFHLSYPYVFKWNDQYYMIPESNKANSVRLYKAINFPINWSFVGSLLEGDFVDSSILYYDKKWWIFAESNPCGNDSLSLFYSYDLVGPYEEHIKSPIIKGDANIARPGGRVLILDGRIIRYAQDDCPTYGNQVRAFEITTLNTSQYEERQIGKKPILNAKNTGWNSKGMHHIDPHQIEGNKNWIACVDGYGEVIYYGLRW